MLTFNLKKVWFDKIKSGEKTHEYRKVKTYWIERLEKFDPDLKNLSKFGDKKIYLFRRLCYVKCGYPKKSEHNKIILKRIKSISLIYGAETDLKINAPVYDIEFEVIE